MFIMFIMFAVMFAADLVVEPVLLRTDRRRFLRMGRLGMFGLAVFRLTLLLLRRLFALGAVLDYHNNAPLDAPVVTG